MATTEESTMKFNYRCPVCAYRCKGKGVRRKNALCPVCLGSRHPQRVMMERLK